MITAAMKQRYFLLNCSTFVLIFLISFHLQASPGDPPDKGGKNAKAKISRLGEYQGYNESNYKGTDYQSLYLAMPDSVKLAIDVFLPKKLEKDKKLPAIVYFVRYGRSLELRKMVKFLGNPFMGHVKKKEVDFFTKHGYACVIVDLRGSGASFGHRTMEFSPEEVEDMSHVLDWLVAQPWSDGKTATTGVSYTGTTAELALSSLHPSLKACVARCNIFDLYDDMVMPGGIRQAPFVDVWKKSTVNLDNNTLGVFGGLAKLMVRGINPVQGDKKRVQLKAAVKEHEANFDIFAGLFRIEARNDVDKELGLTCDAYSIHNRIPSIEKSNVPIYRISGWYDGGNVGGVIKGYWNVKNTTKVLIGPWDHGPDEHISPFEKSKKVKFDVYTEMLRFLDFHLKGIENGIDKEAPFVYYQMGKEEFRAVDSWPLNNEEQQQLYFGPKGKLSGQKSEKTDSCSIYKCDYGLGTGGGARWNSLTPLFRYADIEYKKRKETNERMLFFTATPTTEDIEITGHAIVDIYISAAATDANLFVYLEDLSPKGEVTYITEGCLRAAHRKISEAETLKVAGPFHSYNREDMMELVPGEVALLKFSLQPTSYLLRKGHSIRVSIGVSDIDHFELGKVQPESVMIHHSSQYPSKVELPFIKSKS